MRAISRTLGTGVFAAVAAIGSFVVPATNAVAETTVITSNPSPGTGFAYGTDSWPMSVRGNGPYTEPVLGDASYGGYMGMVGNWARWGGCKTGNFLAWARVNADQANANYVKYHIGVGTGAYWYMGGPGVDPHWNGTTTEAFNWGARQAANALGVVKSRYIPYPVIWADIELPQIAPAPDNGWNSVYTSMCSGKVRQSYVPVAVDRAEFDGFANYITTHSTYKVGVYSAPQDWNRIFGTGPDSKILNTYEWTYEPETSHLSPAAAGWCLHSVTACAQFFGGQTSASKYALMWQWSGGGGVRNGYGDFDQIDVARMK